MMNASSSKVSYSDAISDDAETTQQQGGVRTEVKLTVVARRCFVCRGALQVSFILSENDFLTK